MAVLQYLIELNGSYASEIPSLVQHDRNRRRLEMHQQGVISNLLNIITVLPLSVHGELGQCWKTSLIIAVHSYPGLTKIRYVACALLETLEQSPSGNVTAPTGQAAGSAGLPGYDQTKNDMLCKRTEIDIALIGASHILAFSLQYGSVYSDW